MNDCYMDCVEKKVAQTAYRPTNKNTSHESVPKRRHSPQCHLAIERYICTWSVRERGGRGEGSTERVSFNAKISVCKGKK